MYSVIDIPVLAEMGFPIQRSPAQSLFSGSPKLIAASHVFHRHPAPRHPPSALSSLAIIIYHDCYYIKAPLKLYYPIFSFQRTKRAFALELKAQSSKLKVILNINRSFSFELSTLSFNLVEVNGFEPMTFCVQGRCSPS